MAEVHEALKSHSKAVLCQFEELWANNVNWLDCHLDSIFAQSNKSGTLADVIKTPRHHRPVLTRKTSSPTPLSKGALSNPFLTSELTQTSQHNRTSNASSEEDEAAIEASLVGAVSTSTPIATSKPVPPASVSLFDQKTPTSSKMPLIANAQPELVSLPEPIMPMPMSMTMPIPTAVTSVPAVQAQSTALDSTDTQEQDQTVVPDVQASPEQQTEAMSAATRMDVDDAPEDVEMQEAPEQEQEEGPAEATMDTKVDTTQHQEDTIMSQPESIAKAAPPSPISAFLSSHASRPSALSFKGLFGREKSMGLLNKTSLSHRLTLTNSDGPSLLQEYTPDLSFKRKSEMMDVDMERHSKAFKLETGTTASSAPSKAAPTNRIEALKNKVESMSKSLGPRRISTEPTGPAAQIANAKATSSLPRAKSPAPLLTSPDKSPDRSMPPLFGVPSSLAAPFGTPNKNSGMSSNAFKAFAKSSTAFDTYDSPPKTTGLIRQTSVGNLVKAFESRAAPPTPRGQILSPGKLSPLKKVGYHPAFRTVEEGATTTPPGSPRTRFQVQRSTDGLATKFQTMSAIPRSPGGIKSPIQTKVAQRQPEPEAPKKVPEQEPRTNQDDNHTQAYTEDTEATRTTFFDAPEHVETVEKVVTVAPTVQPANAPVSVDKSERLVAETGAVSQAVNVTVDAVAEPQPQPAPPAEMHSHRQTGSTLPSNATMDVPDAPEEPAGNIGSTFLSQAASLLSKSLGTTNRKPAAPGAVRSLQLAAAAKEREQQDRERRAAIKEEREQQRRLVQIARQQEEVRKKAEEAKLSKPSVDNLKMRKEREDSVSHGSQIKATTASSLKSKAVVPKAKAPLPVVRPDDGPLCKKTVESAAMKKANPPSRPGSALGTNKPAPTKPAAPAATVPREPSRAVQPAQPSKPSVTLKLFTNQTQQPPAASTSKPVAAPGLQPKRSTAKSLPHQESEPYIELPDIDSEYSDSDEETQAAKAAKLPSWAQSPALKAALDAQSRIDPDDIFGAIQPLQMEEVFRGRASKFRARSSSQYWSGTDALTRTEEIAYAKRMQYQSSKLARED